MIRITANTYTIIATIHGDRCGLPGREGYDCEIVIFELEIIGASIFAAKNTA